MSEAIGFHTKLKKLKAKDNTTHHTYAFLCSVLSPVRSAGDLKTDLDINSCDWESVFQVAVTRLIAPLLYRCIKQKELTAMLPADFVNALATFYEANSNRNEDHHMILLDAIKVLNEAGIKPTLLKGAHALVGLLPNADTRILSDIDILVPQPNTEYARQTLLKAGFYHLSDNEQLNSSVRHHHFPPLLHPSGLGYVELHQYPNATLQQPDLIAYCFDKQRILPMQLNGCYFFVSSPRELLIYNQLHHYYSFLDRYKVDIRQMIEQAYLCHQLGEKEIQEIMHFIEHITPESSRIFRLQLALLVDLFGLPDQNISLKKEDQTHIDEILRLLLDNSFSIKNIKFRATLSLFSYALRSLLDFEWLMPRIFNLSWYRSLPRKVGSYISQGNILRS